MAREFPGLGPVPGAAPHFAFVERGTLPNLSERGRRRRFPKGTVLMHQGDPSNAMYLLVHGFVRVERMSPALVKPLHLADLGPGEVVGEIGIINRAPRSATVTALSDVLTIELPREEALRAIREVLGLPAALLNLVSRLVAGTRPTIGRGWS